MRRSRKWYLQRCQIEERKEKKRKERKKERNQPQAAIDTSIHIQDHDDRRVMNMQMRRNPAASSRTPKKSIENGQ